jgi:hypothetical protein
MLSGGGLAVRFSGRSRALAGMRRRCATCWQLAASPAGEVCRASSRHSFSGLLTEPQRSAVSFALLNEIERLETGHEAQHPEVLAALRILEGVHWELAQLAIGGGHE